MDKPLVSIIVPCYNHGKYIEECLDSLFNQTYRYFEIIVIDDGSTDNSVKVLRELQKKAKFILVEQNNRGLSATLNRGLLEYVRGEYVTFCASDDFWDSRKLELQVNFMENNKDFFMCYGKTKYVDLNSEVINIRKLSDNLLRGGYIFEDLFLFKFHPPVNYLYRTRIFEEIGYFNPSIYAEDYHMNLKIASRYPIGFIDEYLGYYRVDNRVEKVPRFLKVSESHLQTIEEYKEHPLYTKAKLIVYLRISFVFSVYKNEKRNALTYLFKAIPIFYHPRFLYTCIRLLFVWK